jgi:DNA primase
VKTTGGRGLHVVAPLKPRDDWAQCLEFARALADTLVRQRPARTPDRFTARTVPNRLARLKADPWKAYGPTKQTIRRGAILALQRL